MLNKLQFNYKYDKIKFNDYDTQELIIKNDISKLLKYNLNNKKLIVLLGDNTYIYNILYNLKFYNKNAKCIIINTNFITDLQDYILNNKNIISIQSSIYDGLKILKKYNITPDFIFYNSDNPINYSTDLLYQIIDYAYHTKSYLILNNINKINLHIKHYINNKNDFPFCIYYNTFSYLPKQKISYKTNVINYTNNKKKSKRIAIIVPFPKVEKKDNDQVLFDNIIKSMKPLDDTIEYKIIFMKQYQYSPYYINIGMLYNIGFELCMDKNYDAFIFHSIYFYPDNEIIKYYSVFPDNPIYLGYHIKNSYNDMSIYNPLIIQKSHFKNVNGYPNFFYVNQGAEYILLNRLMNAGHSFNIPEKGTYYIRDTVIKYPVYFTHNKEKSGLSNLYYTVKKEKIINKNAVMYQVEFLDTDYFFGHQKEFIFDFKPIKDANVNLDIKLVTDNKPEKRRVLYGYDEERFNKLAEMKQYNKYDDVSSLFNPYENVSRRCLKDHTINLFSKTNTNINIIQDYYIYDTLIHSKYHLKFINKKNINIFITIPYLFNKDDYINTINVYIKKYCKNKFIINTKNSYYCYVPIRKFEDVNNIKTFDDPYYFSNRLCTLSDIKTMQKETKNTKFDFMILNYTGFIYDIFDTKLLLNTKNDTNSKRHFHNTLVQIYILFLLLNKNGTCIIFFKLLHLFNKEFIDIIFLLHFFFNNIRIVKGTLNSNLSDNCFLICEGYNKRKINIINLENIIKKLGKIDPICGHNLVAVNPDEHKKQLNPELYKPHNVYINNLLPHIIYENNYKNFLEQIQHLNKLTFNKMYNIYSKITFIIVNNKEILSSLLDKLKDEKNKLAKDYLNKYLDITKI